MMKQSRQVVRASYFNCEREGRRKVDGEGRDRDWRGRLIGTRGLDIRVCGVVIWKCGVVICYSRIDGAEMDGTIDVDAEHSLGL